ncbi:hypothetical protein HB662_22955 [Roseomonas frigidaquae]|uniref:Uncharacterized protein n=1 Tax=Falsiroseomonas frigidaquae TaxID=487318 RepID=A0ABX1F5I3_9PROT|nr:hypothetical protein [Falsiroseomonas frigidaquae]NKE47657.1 hypothetical protein [Falsiroseomonas frigidaquae]
MPDTPLLKLALLGDAAACAASGLLLAAGAGALAVPLDLPEGLLRGAGLALLPWAAFVGFTGSRAAPARGAVLTIIAVNALWVLDSLLLAAGAFGLAPGRLGTAFILAQATIAGGFTALQILALRRAAVPA